MTSSSPSPLPSFSSLISHDSALLKFYSLGKEKLSQGSPGYGGGDSASAFNSVIAACINATSIDTVRGPLSSALGYSQQLVIVKGKTGGSDDERKRNKNENKNKISVGSGLKKWLKEDVDRGSRVRDGVRKNGGESDVETRTTSTTTNRDQLDQIGDQKNQYSFTAIMRKPGKRASLFGLVGNAAREFLITDGFLTYRRRLGVGEKNINLADCILEVEAGLFDGVFEEEVLVEEVVVEEVEENEENMVKTNAGPSDELASTQASQVSTECQGVVENGGGDEEFDSCDEEEFSQAGSEREASKSNNITCVVGPVSEDVPADVPNDPSIVENSPSGSPPTSTSTPEHQSSQKQTKTIRILRFQREFSRSGLLRKPKLDTTTVLEMELGLETKDLIDEDLIDESNDKARECIRVLQREIFEAKRKRFVALDRDTGNKFGTEKGFVKRCLGE